jgi:hypothetical protein
MSTDISTTAVGCSLALITCCSLWSSSLSSQYPLLPQYAVQILKSFRAVGKVGIQLVEREEDGPTITWSVAGQDDLETALRTYREALDRTFTMPLGVPSWQGFEQLFLDAGLTVRVD